MCIFLSISSWLVFPFPIRINFLEFLKGDSLLTKMWIIYPSCWAREFCLTLLEINFKSWTTDLIVASVFLTWSLFSISSCYGNEYNMLLILFCFTACEKSGLFSFPLKLFFVFHRMGCKDSLMDWRNILNIREYYLQNFKGYTISRNETKRKDFRILRVNFIKYYLYSLNQSNHD